MIAVLLMLQCSPTWTQNIITRNFEMKYPGDAHVVSECYIPKLKMDGN